MAFLCTGVLCAAMLSHHARRPDSAVKSPSIRISLLHEEAPPTPTPPAAPLPKTHTVVRRQVAAPPPAPTPENVVIADSPPQTAAIATSAPDPPAPAETASSASIEAQYAAGLRTNIDSRTTVPGTLEYRLFKPRGAARVSFTLERDGTAGKVGLVHGSGSNLLDRQAVSIVQSGRYPPFPERAFPGEARHIFVVTIEFQS